MKFIRKMFTGNIQETLFPHFEEINPTVRNNQEKWYKFWGYY